MSALAVCILLATVVAFSVQGEDLPDSQNFQLLAHKPGDKGYDKNTLRIETLFVKSILKYLTKMEIYMSGLGQSTGAMRVAGVSKYGVYGMKSNDIKGVLDKPEIGEVSSLQITFRSRNFGYCKSYTSKVFGVDFHGVSRIFEKKIQVGPGYGASCGTGEEDGRRLDLIPKKPGKLSDENKKPYISDHPDKKMLLAAPTPKVRRNIEIPKYIKEAFPDATQEQQEEILDKINAIDNDTYDVSSIYQGRIYIATMNDTNFELHKMNELCKRAGGYLVELDSPEEQNFVRDFLRSLRSYRYFTGANDVDSEGNFVYYNSKKPVTNVVWKKGEPNNGGGNESCVEILKKGLNDNKCVRKRGYICEIPLVDEDAKSA